MKKLILSLAILIVVLLTLSAVQPKINENVLEDFISISIVIGLCIALKEN